MHYFYPAQETAKYPYKSTRPEGRMDPHTSKLIDHENRTCEFSATIGPDAKSLSDDERPVIAFENVGFLNSNEILTDVVWVDVHPDFPELVYGDIVTFSAYVGGYWKSDPTYMGDNCPKDRKIRSTKLFWVNDIEIV